MLFLWGMIDFYWSDDQIEFAVKPILIIDPFYIKKNLYQSLAVIIRSQTCMNFKGMKV